MSNFTPQSVPFVKEDFRLCPPGAWTMPAISPEKLGAENYNAIHLEVGRCLSIWETIEESLARLFLVISGDEASKSSLAWTYGYIESSRTRFNVLISAAKKFFGTSFQNNEIKWVFDHLRSDFEAASHRRNEIAHGMAVNWGTRHSSLFSDSLAIKGHLLVAPGYMTARNSQTPPNPKDLTIIPNSSLYCYDDNDLKKMRENFVRFLFQIDKIPPSIRRQEDGTMTIDRNVIWGSAKA